MGKNNHKVPHLTVHRNFFDLSTETSINLASDGERKLEHLPEFVGTFVKRL